MREKTEGSKKASGCLDESFWVSMVKQMKDSTVELLRKREI